MPALERTSPRPENPRPARSHTLPEQSAPGAGGTRAVVWSLLHLAGAALFVALMLARMAQAAPLLPAEPRAVVQPGAAGVEPDR